MTGRILNGSYQLEDCIGSGGMGTIYRARRLRIGDIVAVKILRPEVVNDVTSRERFHREARAAALLNHPNAVVIHDFGEESDGTAYIVMEYIEGRSLRQILATEKTITPTRTWEILRQASAALEAAHRRGIIHRDIKPDNILLVSSDDLSDHVKILDFGIARLRDKSVDTGSLEKSLTTVGTVIGTPHYMSPEQCQGEPADSRSDIYSLGVVLYEMLTGAVPFTAKTPTGVAVKHVTEAPRAPSLIRTDLSQAVERVVMRALSKDPAARQQTTTELSREFDAALRGGDASITGRSDTGSGLKTVSANDGLTQVRKAPEMVPRETPTTAMPELRGYETRISESLSRTDKKKPPVVAIAAGVLLFLLAVAAWWMLRQKAPQTVVTPPRLTPTVTPPAAATVAPTAAPTAAVAPEGMVLIPGGEFRVGRDEGEDADKPAHPATIKPFFMDLTEVTNEAYQRFVTEQNYKAPASWKDGKFPAGAEKLPVTEVTWEDANAYAAAVGKRLPTEEEWEFAARGTDNFRYPWGMEFEASRANISGAAGASKKLLPVGSFPDGKSPFGLLDMSGNAWEWTDSEYKAYPGGRVQVPSGYERSTLRVIRGGSFAVPPDRATTTTRRGWPVSLQDWPDGATADYSQTGFRCAKDTP
ncbi:MAG: SUMF1/EgtB/PvdO family nonheme iron enzyme [Blastocatellia bacterium]